jgi:hypothetical protein
MSVVYLKDAIVLLQREGRGSEEYSFSKKDIITSSIDLQDVINYVFKLPKSLSKQELDVQAEIYFYENAGLDLTKKYLTYFDYKDLKETDEYQLVEAISISHDKLREIFKNSLQRAKYIDYISLSFMAYEKFYDLYHKQSKTDAFIYLDEKQSFISIFQNGKYIYAKSLPLIDKLLKNLNIDYDDFVKIISLKGLDKELYEPSEEFMYDDIDNFFTEYFANINNRFSYGRSVFHIEKIDNIYFYTPFEIPNLNDRAEFWTLTGIVFHKLPVEQFFLEKLILKYNVDHYQDEMNFSIFPKPPKLYTRRSFQLFSVLFLSISIFGGDYANRWYQNNQIQQKINKLNNLIQKEKREISILKQKNKSMLEKQKEYKEYIIKIEKKIEYQKKLLITSIDYMKYSSVTNDFLLITKLLKANSLKTDSIIKNDNNFSISLIATINKRENISVFMRDLIKNGYKNVNTSSINNENGMYSAIVRFTK